MNLPSSQSIKSQDLTIEQLFKNFYIVPNFQREYVWKEKQVEQLLKDVFAEFPNSNTNSEPDEYFLGSVVVSFGDEGEDGPYEVIDGQQRKLVFNQTLLSQSKFLEVMLLLRVQEKAHEQLY